MKQLLLLTGFIILSFSVRAQTDPVKWKFEAKKIADKVYELHLSAVVNDPWHIYSQSTPEGGPLPTKISFSKNPMVSILGVAREKGRLQKKYEEVFDVDVKYFDGNVSFVQVVKLRNNVKTSMKGTIKFMACTDQQCLPPAEVPFNIALN